MLEKSSVMDIGFPNTDDESISPFVVRISNAPNIAKTGISNS